MAMAAAIGPIIGAIGSIAGAMISAAAMQQQADQQEEIAEANARQEERKAALAQAKGALESSKKSKEYDKASALNRAITASSGFSTTEGTPLLQQEDFAAQKFFDTNLVMADATIEQRDRQDNANITRYEGAMKAQASRAQASASLISGVAGGLKGIAGAFG
jgi:mannitol-specific phosphotransferase system IIBC component